MRFLDLFSGIGGFALGLERAGMLPVGFCEINPYCRAILDKHWPSVWKHSDVKTLTASIVQKNCGQVDLICGGFPCQPIASAGKRLKTKDPRWLWPEFFRLVREIRPKFVLLENVPGLLDPEVFGGILSDLAAIGFDAEWQMLSACMLGAPHTRKRVFVVSYPHSFRCSGIFGSPENGGRHEVKSSSARGSDKKKNWNGGFRSDYFRVAYGIPHRVDRVMALGNSVVPQIVEKIGKSILYWTNQARRCHE